MKHAMSRRERKKLRTRQQLLAAASSLFHSRGYEDTTVEGITEEADVAKGTFFNYFASKEDLLDEVVDLQFSRLSEELDTYSTGPESSVARIKQMERLLCEQSESDRQLFQRVLAVQLSTPLSTQHPTGRGIPEFVRNLVKRAQICGEIRADVEADLVSDFVLVAYIHRLAFCSHQGAALSPSRDSERGIDLLLEGLAGPSWRNR